MCVCSEDHEIEIPMKKSDGKIMENEGTDLHESPAILETKCPTPLPTPLLQYKSGLMMKTNYIEQLACQIHVADKLHVVTKCVQSNARCSDCTEKDTNAVNQVIKPFVAPYEER